MEEFVNLNPQLKQIAIYRCTFKIKMNTTEATMESFGHLRNLKFLGSTMEEDRFYTSLVVYGIGEAETALEDLHLSYFVNNQFFMEGILKLTNLKTLRLQNVEYFGALHLIA